MRGLMSSAAQRQAAARGTSTSGGRQQGGGRTAEQIREAYGRPLPNREGRREGLDDVAASMADNRDKLAERGERLAVRCNPKAYC
eukprot:1179725-Prorocentrum_minimum.AAC.2